MAFHPYPQLIPQVFNPGGFGPPRPLTAASPWPWVDHPASGLEHATTDRPVRTRFRYGYPSHGLTSPHATNSQAHSSKGTPSPSPENRATALTDCRQSVSGTISLPSRGTFHLSLTVLVRYRSPGSIQAYQVVLADSRQITGVRRYSGTHKDRPTAFIYRTITVYGAASQRLRLATGFLTARPGVSPITCTSHNPTHATPDRYHTHAV